MSLRFRTGHRVFVYEVAIDMRAGFDRLSMLVREKMARNILEGDLYLFLGKNRRRLKAICFDGTGLVLINKRLEKGNFMSLSDLESAEITSDELDILISGGVIRRRKFGQEVLTAIHEPRIVNLDATPRTRD
jgi:transposase